ncbi:DUF3995 domain-containing protein [Sphingoaurantiacus capsulatus]|uniref:DUF3995 domain-containing protein n=1 Tax=Sphingoaurantiacus capsulatus TaxID=1771310 RepID=A0ABV7XD88_9SPHN
MSLTNSAAALLVAILAGIAALHALWGIGVTFPAADRQSLALLVVGRPQLPPPVACFVVASFVAALAVLPALALGWIAAPAWLARLAGWACWAAAALFVVRGIGGYLAAFERMFPLEPFASFNRFAYSPLCLLLALLFVVVARARV